MLLLLNPPRNPSLNPLLNPPPRLGNPLARLVAHWHLVTRPFGLAFGRPTLLPTLLPILLPILLIGLLLAAPGARAQQNTPQPAPQPTELHLLLTDSSTRQAVPGGQVVLVGTTRGAVSDGQGRVRLAGVPPGPVRVVVTALGYRPRTLLLAGTPAGGTALAVQLAPAAEELEEVVVTATRTTSRLADLPVRVEVLGEEEMREENGIKPGNIASLLGDIAGAQIQPTSPVTGNADLRLQGLPGRYAQILRDGLPLLGGYAGSFGVLSVPPLDLRQIELIKGAASSLYGGGAIAGMVNLVAKQPRLHDPEYSATANYTTLGEANLNAFAAARTARVGYSLFAGSTTQQGVDVDGDGFTDVPRLRSVVVHPRVFWYPTARLHLNAGYTATLENRRGGYLPALADAPAATLATATGYVVANALNRHTADATLTLDSLPAAGRLTVRATLSGFERRVTAPGLAFAGRQLSGYAETSYLATLSAHTLVAGATLAYEALHPQATAATPLRAAYTYQAPGVFLQDDWRLSPVFRVQAGLRLEQHSRFGRQWLPRVGVLAQVAPTLTVRLNGGTGYRAPVPYSNDLDERAYPLVLPLAAGLPPERALGLTGDVNWQHRFASGARLTLNQAVFYTQLRAGAEVLPADPAAGLPGGLAWQATRAASRLVSRGLETYARLTAGATELYLGYVLTDARRPRDVAQPYVPLNARHKFSTVLVRELGGHWGAGLEAAYTGRQYLPDPGQPTRPGYPFVAALVRYHTGPWTVVLNGENLFDYRQTRREAVVTGPLPDPTFRPLWAPVEGRVLNLSATWRFQPPAPH